MLIEQTLCVLVFIVNQLKTFKGTDFALATDISVATDMLFKMWVEIGKSLSLLCHN